ncbi:hypothetical protein ACR2R6_10675 [Methylocaldum gracile subsp. desertum]|uniref:hypothetical protein n=1 Tax=Methylocaldum sp. GT1BW TaxID=3438964 RepID=UPI003D9FB2FD
MWRGNPLVAMIPPYLLGIGISLLMTLDFWRGGESGSSTHALFLYAIVSTAVGYILYPVKSSVFSSPLLAIFVWSSGAAISIFAFWLVVSVTLALPLVIRLGLAIGLIQATILLLRHVIGRRFSQARAGVLVAALTILCASSPIWLSPWLEWSGEHSPLMDLALAMSPPTCFAVALDYDYLRSPWFYKHTAYAMHRYEYPSAGLLIFVYGFLCLAAVRIDRRFRKSSPNEPFGKFQHDT